MQAEKTLSETAFMPVLHLMHTHPTRIVFSASSEAAVCFYYPLTDLYLIFVCTVLQAALPQGIVPFVFAKEYNVHPDILSTA
jgi:hypothetical protein